MNLIGKHLIPWGARRKGSPGVPGDSGTHETGAKEGEGREVSLEDQRFRKKESLEDQEKEDRKKETFGGSEELRSADYCPF